jgi:hypothetical protein
MVIARQALDLPANDAALFSVRFCAVHPKFRRMPDASIFRGPLYTFVLINSCTAPHASADVGGHFDGCYARHTDARTRVPGNPWV